MSSFCTLWFLKSRLHSKSRLFNVKLHLRHKIVYLKLRLYVKSKFIKSRLYCTFKLFYEKHIKVAPLTTKVSLLLMLWIMLALFFVAKYGPKLQWNTVLPACPQPQLHFQSNYPDKWVKIFKQCFVTVSKSSPIYPGQISFKCNCGCEQTGDTVFYCNLGGYLVGKYSASIIHKISNRKTFVINKKAAGKNNKRTFNARKWLILSGAKISQGTIFLSFSWKRPRTKRQMRLWPRFLFSVLLAWKKVFILLEVRVLTALIFLKLYFMLRLVTRPL